MFLGVLASFATLFAQAINYIYIHFKATSSIGLGVALAEGVSALDRLSSYCFTRFPRSLLRSVLQLLGTIDSIEQGGWPFLDPCMLNLQGARNLSLAL